MRAGKQTTLCDQVAISGIGVHSGLPVTLTLLPADANTGVIFVRSGIKGRYEREVRAWLDSGFLTRLDTAFSRDQAEKIYVQHRMLAAADEFWRWLEAGAYLCLCGDAKRMAPDVDAALQQVVMQAGARTAAEAKAYIQALRAAKRYRKDVY